MIDWERALGSARRCRRFRLRAEMSPFPLNSGDAFDLGLAERVEAVHEGNADMDLGGLVVGVS